MLPKSQSTICSFCLILIAIGSLGFAQSASAQDLSGKWRGAWVSQSSGHRGKLNARMTQNNNGQYRAVFTGTFAKIIPFRYAVNLDVVGRNGNQLHLAGSKKLGPIMGEFRYSAVSDGCSFRASYSSKRDSGQWNLDR